ncbi:DUF2782 domain-containing protein [Billgrantia sp. LNSP4103-1]|uniref:DUF2782 domain-containing protein n=1 Tax=Billgrantia sp. LNSP4103-1 TaxID=3410266 RepID=UPI00403F0A16
MYDSRRFLTAVLLALGLAMAVPALAQSAADAKPDITVRQEQDRTIREYRIDGQLYAIEIRPRQGAGYFLVDHDGDGNFERQEGDRVTIPRWVLAD